MGGRVGDFYVKVTRQDGRMDYGDSALYSAHPVQRLALSRHATSSRNAAPAPMGTPRSPSCAANAARRRVTGMGFHRKGMGVKCTVTVIPAPPLRRSSEQA